MAWVFQSQNHLRQATFPRSHRHALEKLFPLVAGTIQPMAELLRTLKYSSIEQSATGIIIACIFNLPGPLCSNYCSLWWVLFISLASVG